MNTIVVKSTDLHRVLANVLPFAADDDSRPVLCGIHLVVSAGDKRMWAVAADPFTLAYDACELVDAGESAELTLPREIVELLLREIKVPMRGREAVLIREDRVEIGNVVAAYEPLANYPDFRKVLALDEPTPAQMMAGETSRVALSPVFMERFRRVKSDSSYYMRIRLRGERAAVEVCIGSSFKALVMPLRADGHEKRPQDPPRLEALTPSTATDGRDPLTPAERADGGSQSTDGADGHDVGAEPGEGRAPSSSEAAA